MSTTSSAILAPASIFSENLIKPLFRHRISDARFLLITKICVVFFSVVASVMACMRSNIYELVGESSILSLVSLFVPLTLGLYWKKASSAGAILSMFAGILSWFLFDSFESEIPAMISATVVSLIAMVGGSYWRPDAVGKSVN